GETRYKTSGNRVEDLHEDDRYRPGLLQQRRQNRRAGGKNDVRRERNQFGSIFADPHRVARGPTDVDLQVATLAPTELLKSLAKCCQSAQRLLVIVSPRQQHTDPPHALGLLRPHSERPRGCRATERDQQFPRSDEYCHTPLPCEVRKGTIPRHERAVLTFKGGRMLVAC